MKMYMVHHEPGFLVAECPKCGRLVSDYKEQVYERCPHCGCEIDEGTKGLIFNPPSEVPKHREMGKHKFCLTENARVSFVNVLLNTVKSPTEASDKLGISRASYYGWISMGMSPLAEAAEDVRSQLVMSAEELYGCPLDEAFISVGKRRTEND